MAETVLFLLMGALKVLVSALGIVLILGIALLFVRLRLILHAERDKNQIWIAIGPFRFSPQRLRNVLKQAVEGQQQSDLPLRSKEKKTGSQTASQRENIIELVLSLLDDLGGLVDFPVFRLDAVIAAGDPARTGILVGQAAVLVSNLYPWLMSRFAIQNPHIWIDGDFESGHHSHWVFDLEARTRLIRTLRFLTRRQKDVARLGRWMRTLG